MVKPTGQQEAAATASKHNLMLPMTVLINLLSPSSAAAHSVNTIVKEVKVSINKQLPLIKAVNSTSRHIQDRFLVTYVEHGCQ